MKTPRLAAIAVLGLVVLFLVAPADEGDGGSKDESWREVHARRVAEAKERLEAERASIERALPGSWEDLAARVAAREAALAEARREVEGRLETARAEAARTTEVHDFYAAGMDRAAALFERYQDLGFRVNKLKSEIAFLESYVPVVEKRITELTDEEEKAKLAQSLRDDLLRPIEAKTAALADCEAEWARVEQARKDYYGFYESRMQTWMSRMRKAEGLVKLLEEELADVAFDVEEARPELALSEAEAKAWEHGQAIRHRLAAAPEVDPASASSACVLCHFTPDEAYFASGRPEYGGHPRVAGLAGEACADCHGGDPAGESFRAAGHERMVPTRLLAAAPAGEDDPRSLAAVGEELWEHHRCAACHDLDGRGPVRRAGTQLDGLNGWAHYEWIVRWLVDPDPYARDASSPRYGLSERQAQAIALYLWQFAHAHHHHHGGDPAAATTSEHATDQRPDAAGGHGDGHDHSHGPPADIGATITAYDVYGGRALFQDVGCLGCHMANGRTEPVGVTEGLPDEKRRLAFDYPPGKPYIPAGTVIDKKILQFLKQDGLRTIEVLDEAPLGPELIDQRARLAVGFPPQDPIYPAGTVIDREVYEFLKAERVQRVPLEGRGNGFAPDLSFAGDKLKKVHLTMWIENPVVHQAQAAMPVFGLSASESWLIATYLQERHAPKRPRALRKGIWKEVERKTAAGIEFALAASTPVLAAGPEVGLEITLRFPGVEDPVAPSDFGPVTGQIAPVEAPGEPFELLPFVDGERRVYEFFFRFPEPGTYSLRVQLTPSEGAAPIEVAFDVVVGPFESSLEAQGRRLANELSCGSCHVIPGVEAPARHDLASAVRAKLAAASGSEFAGWLVDRMAHHRLPGSGVDSYRFDEFRSRALAAFVLDRVRVPGARRALSPREALDRAVEPTLDRFNCRGCHRLGGDPTGGTIGPDLSIAGLRFGAGYLDRYLAAPTRVRPAFGSAIMPRFAFEESERRQLASWLAGRGQDHPAADLVREAGAAGTGDAKRGEALVQEFRCRSCHLIGEDKRTVDDTTDYTIQELVRHRKRAPRLVDLGARLDPAWLAAWIKDPHRFLPDTPMPDHEFSIEDAVAIREYLLQFRTPPAPGPKKDPNQSQEGSEKR